MKYYAISIAVALLSAGLAYYVSLSWICALAIFAFFVLLFSFWIIPVLSKFVQKERKRHECYRFVNSFIITLSVTSSYEEAFKSASEGSEKEEAALLAAIDLMSVSEKLSYLSNYFEESYYPMFVSVLKLYEEQGGDLLDLAEPLLSDVTDEESGGDAVGKIRTRYLVQYIALWLLANLVLVCVRLGLSGFYEELVASPAYLATSMIFFALEAGSLAFFASLETGMVPQRKRKDKHVSSPSSEKNS